MPGIRVHDFVSKVPMGRWVQYGTSVSTAFRILPMRAWRPSMGSCDAPPRFITTTRQRCVSESLSSSYFGHVLPRCLSAVSSSFHHCEPQPYWTVGVLTPAGPSPHFDRALRTPPSSTKLVNGTAGLRNPSPGTSTNPIPPWKGGYVHAIYPLMTETIKLPPAVIIGLSHPYVPRATLQA